MGYLFPGLPDYWCAQSHPQVPGVTGVGEVRLKLILQVTPLNAGNLRCKRAHIDLLVRFTHTEILDRLIKLDIGIETC